MRYNKDVTSEEDFFNFSIEGGAEDGFIEEDTFEAVSTPETLSNLYNYLDKKFGEPVSSGFQWKPVTYVAIEGDKLKSLINLLNELDNDEDVQQVFSNFEASDEELAKFA